MPGISVANYDALIAAAGGRRRRRQGNMQKHVAGANGHTRILARARWVRPSLSRVLHKVIAVCACVFGRLRAGTLTQDVCMCVCVCVSA